MERTYGLAIRFLSKYVFYLFKFSYYANYLYFEEGKINMLLLLLATEKYLLWFQNLGKYLFLSKSGWHMSYVCT